jgi:tight adherence protein C
MWSFAYFLNAQIGTLGIIGLGLGILALLIFLFLYFKGLHNAKMFEAVEESEFQLKEIYFVGLAFWETLKYKWNSTRDKKLLDNLNILYPPQYAQFYLRVVKSQQVTMAFLGFFIGWLLFAVSKTNYFIFVAFLLAALAYYYYGSVVEQKINKRKFEMLSDFAEVVSKLALLTSTGMILTKSWEEVARGGDSVIYKEMQLVAQSMENGVSQVRALSNFANRSKLQEVKKFVSLVIQGISKGNAELISMLHSQSNEIWELKKQMILRQGAKASTKLMAPMMLMFAGILIIIVVPLFTNMGF